MVNFGGYIISPSPIFNFAQHLIHTSRQSNKPLSATPTMICSEQHKKAAQITFRELFATNLGTTCFSVEDSQCLATVLCNPLPNRKNTLEFKFTMATVPIRVMYTKKAVQTVDVICHFPPLTADHFPLLKLHFLLFQHHYGLPTIDEQRLLQHKIEGVRLSPFPRIKTPPSTSFNDCSRCRTSSAYLAPTEDPGARQQDQRCRSRSPGESRGYV